MMHKGYLIISGVRCWAVERRAIINMIGYVHRTKKTKGSGKVKTENQIRLRRNGISQEFVELVLRKESKMGRIYDKGSNT